MKIRQFLNTNRADIVNKIQFSINSDISYSDLRRLVTFNFKDCFETQNRINDVRMNQLITNYIRHNCTINGYKYDYFVSFLTEKKYKYIKRKIDLKIKTVFNI